LKSTLDCIIDGIPSFFKTKERFFLHPLNFDETRDYEDGEEEAKRKKIILNFIFKELNIEFRGLELLVENNGEKLFKTNRPNILLGFDGQSDWWLEPCNVV